MAKNSNLHQAKKAHQDEFYTLLSDIEKELVHYREFFRDKVVYCNCDSLQSNFFKYFFLNFKFLGLKRLICTSYNENGHGTFFMADQGDVNNNGLPDENEVRATELEGNGDFRSLECIEILKTADVVVTNGPFSLFREYIAQLVAYDKMFLVIGNMNAITYKEIFPLIKNKELWLGCSLHGVKCHFTVPDNYEGKNVFIEDGVRYAKVNNSIWFTNIDHKKRHQPLDLYKHFNIVEFPQYDNYCAFNVDKTTDIPLDDFIEIDILKEDYGKWSSVYKEDLEVIEEQDRTLTLRIYRPIYGVPITFLDKYCPEQFEIVGLDRYVEGNTMPNKRMHINGKELYARILIRRKK